jgi:hypothetical protein
MSLSTLPELKAQFDALTTRIVALDRDIALETDSERRSVAQQKRAELARERETIAGEMEMIQQGGSHVPPASTIEHRVSTLEHDVAWLKQLVQPGARRIAGKLIFYGLLIVAWSIWMIGEIRSWLLVHPVQAIIITLALGLAALIVRWLPEDDSHDQR